MNTNKILLIILIIIAFILGMYLTNDYIEESFNNNNDDDGMMNKKTKLLDNVYETNDLNNIVSKYNKYNETLISEHDGIENSELYKNYMGDLKNKKVWKNMTLSQCKDACNKLEGCVGFSRDNVDNDSEANCFPRSHISICHSIRKGSPLQRENASKYNTYIKLNVGNQKNKCLGTNNLTLHRNIILKSFSKPDHFVSNLNNEIKLKKYNFKGSEFLKNCRFKIVPGLSGEGTVSFQIIDNFNEKYYLCDNGLGSITIIPINMDDSKRTDLLTRNRASFELLDGYANKHQITLRTYSLTNNHKYLILKNSNSEEPKIGLVNSKTALKNPKDVTFDIIDDIKHKSVLDIDREYITQRTKPKIKKSKIGFSSQEFRGRRISSNDTDNSNKEEFKSSKKLKEYISIQNKIDIILLDGTKIAINESTPDLRKLHPLYNEIDNNLNDIKIKIVKIKVNSPNYQVGLFRYPEYKGGSPSNPPNHSNPWKSDYSSDIPQKYNNFYYVSENDDTKPNLILESGDVLDLKDNVYEQKIFNSKNRGIHQHEKLLNKKPHNMLWEFDGTKTKMNNIVVHSIRLVRIMNLNEDIKLDNEYQYLLDVEKDVEKDIGSRNYDNISIDNYITTAKKKLMRIKEKINDKDRTLLEKYKNNERALRELKASKGNLQMQEYANEYYFLKNRSEDVTKNFN